MFRKQLISGFAFAMALGLAAPAVAGSQASDADGQTLKTQPSKFGEEPMAPSHVDAIKDPSKADLVTEKTEPDVFGERWIAEEQHGTPNSLKYDHQTAETEPSVFTDDES